MSWYLLAAVPVFALLVIVHEFGHFITAKWAGIRVEEFAVGFPPRLFGVQRGETMYSINLLPLGGYVKMPGENGETTDAEGHPDPGTFGAKSASKRAIVLLAGVTMNLILAVVLFSAAEVVGKVTPYAGVGTVVAGSPAAQAGLQVGDHIISIAGHPVTYFSDVIEQTNSSVADAPAGAKTVPVVVSFEHAGSTQPQTVTVQALVHPASGQGHFGIGADYHYTQVDRVSLAQAPVAGVRDIGTVIVDTGNVIGQIVHGTIAANTAVQGPVGIVTDTGAAASLIPVSGWYWILFLTAALSLNLAIVNILPIPALDGGRLLLIVIEVLRRGKRLTPEREALVNLIGMGALLFLMLLVTINDVGSIIGGH